MSEEDLAKYIPHYGDRLATVAFWRNSHQLDTGAARRSHLLNRVRAKSSAMDSRGVKRMGTSEKMQGNKNAKRPLKRVEIGWMNFNKIKNEFKQVRAVKGGGTRHVSVDGYTKVSEIQLLAESLFFPNDFCKSLMLESDHRSILDFSQGEVNQNCTVDDLCEKNKVKLLRLYLYTKNHDHSKDEEATTSEVTGNAAHNLYSVPGTEPEVITFDLNVLQDSDVILLDDPNIDAGADKTKEPSKLQESISG